MLPEPKLLFQQLEARSITEGGAREVFQMLVTDLVSLEHPTAAVVAAPGGQDWGIDTYVGRFDDTLTVWQSKFFLRGVGPSQQQQIRESFKQVLDQATANELTIDAWFLAVPCDMAPEERRWFDGWAGRQAREVKFPLSLWGGSDLRRKLMRADAEDIRRDYFGGVLTTSPRSETVVIKDDLSEFDDALFVRQLHEAGRAETDAARGLFFAADALFRDLAARGDEAAISAMGELHLEVQYLWEQHFNQSLPQADAAGRMAGLIDQVITGAGNVPDPAPLRLRPAHRRGVAHRLVEEGRAGWVAHWRQVADHHQLARVATTDFTEQQQEAEA